MADAGLQHKNPNLIVRGTKEGVSRKTVRELFCEKPDQKFVVPLFQRRYLWGENQCRKILDDIINVSATTPHFIGTVMTYTNEEEEKVIVDGQQRTTTLLLLIAILRDKGVCTKDVSRANDPSLFRPTYHDREPFAAVIKGSTPTGDSNIIDVVNWYNLWVDELTEDTRKDCLTNMLDHFWLLDFTIPHDDQADGLQVIYERLAVRSIEVLGSMYNPRPGLYIGVLDLARNLFLSYYNEADAIQIYHSTWIPLELMVARNDYVYSEVAEIRFGLILKAYLSVKKWDILDEEKNRKLGIYFAFKRYMHHVTLVTPLLTGNKNVSAVTNLMKELLNFIKLGNNNVNG